jgi:hypothetical protein
MPNISQLKKPIGGTSGKRRGTWERKIPFGGLPMGVPSPPILAAHATERSRHPVKAVSPGDNPAESPLPFRTREFPIAIAIGTIIIAVAVLEIHIEINAVAVINPRIRRRGEVPAMRIICRAIRWCRFHRSIERAMIKPPRNRKITGSAYGAADCCTVRIPRRGNATSGTSAVASRGIASVTQSVTIRATTAAVRRA